MDIVLYSLIVCIYLLNDCMVDLSSGVCCCLVEKHNAKRKSNKTAGHETYIANSSGGRGRKGNNIQILKKIDLFPFQLKETPVHTKCYKENTPKNELFSEKHL